ncbi:nuclear transport factor 2 family protein [Janthinobacterium sp. Mn2066]|uniref:nuclear transport factor 2 family protein n=1 Tax=Janthinobacterium sp. Mn2066 TaxID=3395264 RepID=UPI003BBC4DC8
MYTTHKNDASAATLMACHLQLIGTDLSAWLALLAHDAAIEFPYAASLGLPVRIAGRQAIAAYMQSISGSLQAFEFSQVEITASADGRQAWASFHGEAKTRSGRAYSQDYAALMEVRDGKIRRYREFWNPCHVAWALEMPLVIEKDTGSRA